MRIVRSYIDCPLTPGLELALPESASNHIVRVLRMVPGELLHLFNGDGHDYPAEILSLEKRIARVRIISCIAIGNESPLRIHLYQSIARGEKMDWILQKATELGVAAFTPLLSDRTEVKLDQERSDKRLSHWHGVIHSACEQSGRALIPAIHAPVSISRLESGGVAQGYYLQPGAVMRLADLSPSLTAETALAIGPEGGFSERDIQLLQNAGFKALSLGPRVLRTETAGIAVIAALQSHFGDF